MHRELSLGDALVLSDVTQQTGGELNAFTIEYMPADNFAAEDVHKNVEIEMHCAHGCTRSKRRWASWPTSRTSRYSVDLLATYRPWSARRGTIWLGSESLN